jgi:hypothetical protein
MSKQRFNIAKVVAEKEKGSKGLFQLNAVDKDGNKMELRGSEFGRGQYFSTLNDLLTDGSIPNGSKELEFEEVQAVLITRNGRPVGIARVVEKQGQAGA